MGRRGSRSIWERRKRQKAESEAKLLSEKEHGETSGEVSEADRGGNGHKDNGKDTHKGNNQDHAKEHSKKGSGEELEERPKHHGEGSEEGRGDRHEHKGQEMELPWVEFSSEEDYDSNEEEEKYEGAATFEYVRIRPGNGSVSLALAGAEQLGVQSSSIADEDSLTAVHGSSSGHVSKEADGNSKESRLKSRPHKRKRAKKE